MKRKQHVEVLKFMSHVSEHSSNSAGWNALARDFISVFHNDNFPMPLTYQSVVDSIEKNKKLKKFLTRLPADSLDQRLPDSHQLGMILMIVGWYHIDMQCENFFFLKNNERYTLFIDDRYCLNIIEVAKGYQLISISNIVTKNEYTIDRFLTIKELKSFLNQYLITCEMNKELLDMWYFN